MLEKNYRRAYRMQLHEDDYGADKMHSATCRIFLHLYFRSLVRDLLLF